MTVGKAYFQPRPQEIDYVMQNLREASREEIELQGLDPMIFGKRLHENELNWVIYNGSAPAALIGAMPVRKGQVYTLYGMGTPHWIDVWRLVTLVARRDMFASVRATGAFRAHCVSPSWHEDTHRWLRVLGASHEVDLPLWGINGEDFKMFSWLREK